MTFGDRRDGVGRACDVEDLGRRRHAGARVDARGRAARSTTPLLGRGNLSNVLAATAVALEFGVPLDDIVAARRGSACRPTAAASSRRLRDGIRLVDDSYNSSPSALREALEVVAQRDARRRKVAVLGEMLELGDHCHALHRECGRAAARRRAARLFAIGGAPARALGRRRRVGAGMPASAVRWFDDERAGRAGGRRRRIERAATWCS